MTSTGKKCRTCGENKALGEYHKQMNNPDGFNVHCKLCISEKRKTHWKKYRKKKKYEEVTIPFINWPATKGFEIK